jgi:hypothetical protein
MNKVIPISKKAQKKLRLARYPALQSGAVEFSVHLSPAVGAPDISVSEFHSYPDRVYTTSSAETSPPFRHSLHRPECHLQ